MTNFENYYSYLNNISLWGRIYKRYFVSLILYFHAIKFGYKIAEIGSGIGSGILGAFPKKVTGFDINPIAVAFCKENHLNAILVEEGFKYPAQDGEYDVCILDNVLEHIDDPSFILKECARISKKNAGLIIVVPGTRGFLLDDDHKQNYSEQKLNNIDQGWKLTRLFSIPFFLKSDFLSSNLRQYCLIAVYKKKIL